MGLPLYVIGPFSFASLNIVSLCLVLISLFSMYLGMFLLQCILYGMLCASWTWLTISFTMLGKFWTIIPSKIFSYYLFFFSPSGTSAVWMLVCLVLSYKSLKRSSVLFFSFFLILLFRGYFHHFIFQLTGSLFCFGYSAVTSFWSIFNISNCVVCLCMFIL